MKKKFGWLIFSLFLGSFLLAGCAATGKTLDGTSWKLDRYQDENGDMTSVKSDTIVTALFQGDKVTGIASCNNYSSSYQVSGNRLTFGPAATTRKMCTDPLGIMKQEDAFLTSLEQVKTFKLSSAKLEMQAAGGETLLVFNPAGQ